MPVFLITQSFRCSLECHHEPKKLCLNERQSWRACAVPQDQASIWSRDLCSQERSLRQSCSRFSQCRIGSTLQYWECLRALLLWSLFSLELALPISVYFWSLTNTKLYRIVEKIWEMWVVSKTSVSMRLALEIMKSLENTLLLAP